MKTKLIIANVGQKGNLPKIEKGKSDKLLAINDLFYIAPGPRLLLS